MNQSLKKAEKIFISTVKKLGYEEYKDYTIERKENEFVFVKFNLKEVFVHEVAKAIIKIGATTDVKFKKPEKVGIRSARITFFVENE